jgi:flagellar M-ring protein FliF
VVKRTRQPQGIVRRMSVSVLLDHDVRLEGTRRVLEAPAPERLKSTRELISAVVGLQPERGDQLIVEAMPFEATRLFEPPPAPPAQSKPVAIPGLPAWLSLPPNGIPALWVGIGIAGALILATLAGLAIRRGRRRNRLKTTNQAETLSAAAHAGLNPGAENPAGSQLDAKIGQQMALNAAMKERQEMELLNTLKLPANATNKAEVLAKRLSEEARRDPAQFAQVIRAWVTDSEA